LTGGDFAVDGFEELVAEVCKKYPFVSHSLAWRWVRSYGTCVWKMLELVETESDLGAQFGGSLTACEIIYLMQNEWAQTADDVVWRLSKLGIRMKQEEIAELDEWMSAHSNHQTRAAE
jgi:glycerol-3-phosphate dehydrogenase